MKQTQPVQRSYGFGIGIATILALSILGGLATPNSAPGNSADSSGGGPANKLAAAGSTVEIMNPGDEVSLLATSIKIGGPKELVLQLTAECALWTSLTTVGNDYADAFAQVVMWVELNGEPVPVSGNDNGQVVFCNRFESRETSLFDDEDATIQTFKETRQANAFNWLTFDVGSGEHTIEVFAAFTTETCSRVPDGAECEQEAQTAKAGVGKRTLIVEPVHAPNGATI